MSYELAWAAGFYDGEGSMSCTSNNGHLYTRIQFSIGQKDYNGCVDERLERFKAVIGVGKIYVKALRGRETNQHQFLIMKTLDIRKAIGLLWPYLSIPKKRQAIRALLLRAAGRERLITVRKQGEKLCRNLQVGRPVMTV